jgi:hypothetical protein
MLRELMKMLQPGLVTTDERRETVRLNCRLEVLLWVDDDLHFATVVDVTLTGLCLAVEKPLRVGQTVSLARDDYGRPWQGQVLWCRTARTGRGYRAGVGYPADAEMLRSSWLRPALTQADLESRDPVERRRLLRVSGRLACTCRDLASESSWEGTMLDLSLGGALFSSREPMSEGQEVHWEARATRRSSLSTGLAVVLSSLAEPEGQHWHSHLQFTQSQDAKVRKLMAGMHRSRTT